jgi:penicillin-binding protein 2
MLLQRTIQLRIFLLIGFALISGAIMLVRLFHLQVVAGDQYVEMVDANRFFTVTLPKERGTLVDRYGNQLVFNEATYFQRKYPDKLYGEVVPITREAALPLLATDAAQVAIAARRWYPLGSAAAHILGYTGPVTADDIKANPTRKANEVIGKFGLERAYEELLMGLSSRQIYEVTALGKKNRLLRTELGRPGSSLTTTLDPFLMMIAQQAMGEKTGAVVLQDAQTGAVLALISTPSFDPNLMSRRESDPLKEQERREKVREFFSSPQQLFFNRAIAGAYPPGSVFKLITALGGLESGKFDASTTVEDAGTLQVGEYSYANWYFSQYGRTEGSISLQRALARSNDIYFYKAAEWMGPEKLAEFARLFGYGSKTGLELSGEAAGFVPTPAWKEEQQGEKWYLGNSYHFGIGQGDLLVTPLQVSQMSQAIANHGVLCQPSLLAMDAKQCRSLGVAEEHLETVLGGMIAACSTGGTAFPFFPWNSEVATEETAPTAYQQLGLGAVACKTGTAEFGVNTALNKKKTHGWFTMTVSTEAVLNSPTASQSATVAAPVRKPADTHLPDYADYATWLRQLEKNNFPEFITITVLVESDEANPYREGSRDAAPVAKMIMDWMGGVALVSAPSVVPPPGVVGE